MTKNIDKNSTEYYLLENKRLESLRKIIIPSRKKIKYESESLLFLIQYKYKILKNYKQYMQEKKEYKEWIISLKKLKNIKNGKKALVIGNGPSQGYATQEILNDFQNNGGEIFVVNFWNQNKRLSNVTPNYLVISDPLTLSKNNSEYREKNESLENYIKTNKNIKIICPTYRCYDLADSFGKDRIIGFIDTELRGWTKNIKPIKPRGYVSMTLYKALAMALWFGYEKINILGMDNTYPRNTYCDSNNRILNLETHAGIEDYITDHSERYEGIGDLMVDLSHLFYDAQKFANKKILNLDPYSLTDAFLKAESIELTDLLK